MSVIPLAAILVHHCVDEDGMVCIEMHAPTIREMAIAAKDEHDSLRARIAELEARVESLIREHLEREKETGETWHNRLIEEAAIKLNERARAEKAEAEIAGKNILIADREQLIGEKQVEIDSIRAERDRYLAAIVEYVGVEDVKEIEVAYAALRRIAEEKP